VYHVGKSAYRSLKARVMIQYTARQPDTAHDGAYQYVRVRDRMGRRLLLGTSGSRGLSLGYRRNLLHLHQQRISGNSIVENHRKAGSEMVPARLVITSPHSAQALRASIVGTGKDERTAKLALLAG